MKKIKTEIVSGNKEGIHKAVKALMNGGMVIYPTESSYALGCAIGFRNVVKKIYRLKKRSNQKALPVIVSSGKMAAKYAYLNTAAKKLIKKFMPGPLSLRVKTKRRFPKRVSKETLVFRIPGNKMAQELCRRTGQPLASTSANISGKESIYNGRKVIEMFNGKVSVIINVGNLKKRKPSTIYDCLEWKILRKGPVSEKEIRKVING